MAKNPNQSGGPSGEVVVLQRCFCEGCGKKSERLNFCAEHYDWFKFGVITKEGKRPTDFDKKMQSYMKRKKAA